MPSAARGMPCWFRIRRITARHQILGRLNRRTTMTRSFLGTAPALAAALWLVGAASQSTAQSVVDTTVDSASDTAAGANASTGVADTATDAGSSTEASTSTESATSTPSTVTSP